MNIQIFGTTKCFDTKKAQRYFKELLRFYDYDLNHVAEPGDFDLFIGGSSQAARTARITLK